MQVFDASSIIGAWDSYPRNIFPPMWDWMSGLVQSQDIVLSEVAVEEVGHNSPECRDWLDKNHTVILPVDGEVLTAAQQLKPLIDISNDNYHAAGVDENDLLIIATAQVHQAPLVSDEALQTSLPLDKRKYKIPAVCGLAQVNVPCTNFLDFLRQQGPSFA